MMEADFKSANKLVYSVNMLENSRKYKLMPEEIFSKKGKMTDYQRKRKQARHKKRKQMESAVRA